MKISDIDKNLKVETSIDREGIVWFSVKEAPFTLHGLCETHKNGGYHRMPESVAGKVSNGVGCLNYHTAGGRVRFKTNSPFVAIKTKQYKMGPMSHMAKTGQSGFDLYCEKGYVACFVPPPGVTEGYESIKDTHLNGEHTFTINFPLYDIVEELLIGLDEKSTLSAPDEYTHSKPVVFYGSSITQGCAASRPGNCYESLISRALDTDYINLGFSGSAKAEQLMAEYCGSLDTSVFVYDYDWNALTLDELCEMHYPFYKTYRALQPDTSIICISRPDFHDFDESASRRDLIRANVEKARAEGDKNIYFIDGERLFDGPHSDSCTVDGCHPNDLGHYRMSQAIEKVLKGLI